VPPVEDETGAREEVEPVERLVEYPDQNALEEEEVGEVPEPDTFAGQRKRQELLVFTVEYVVRGGHGVPEEPVDFRFRFPVLADRRKKGLERGSYIEHSLYRVSKILFRSR